MSELEPYRPPFDAQYEFVGAARLTWSEHGNIRRIINAIPDMTFLSYATLAFDSYVDDLLNSEADSFVQFGAIEIAQDSHQTHVRTPLRIASTSSREFALLRKVTKFSSDDLARVVLLHPVAGMLASPDFQELEEFWQMGQRFNDDRLRQRLGIEPNDTNS